MCKEKIDELELSVSKLNLKEGEMLVLKTDRTITDPVYNRIMERMKEFLPKGNKALLFEDGMDIGIFPPRDRKCYGVWMITKEHWARNVNGDTFYTVCIGVARNYQKGFLVGTEVRVFNDDGTPGELIE